jgi:hypothetical protein
MRIWRKDTNEPTRLGSHKERSSTTSKPYRAQRRAFKKTTREMGKGMDSGERFLMTVGSALMAFVSPHLRIPKYEICPAVAGELERNFCVELLINFSLF